MVFDASVVEANHNFGDRFYYLKFQAAYFLIGWIILIIIGHIDYHIYKKFIPYIFIVFIAIILAVPISNSYETLRADATIGSTFTSFTGSNFIMNYLPIIVAIVGITGGIIMFVRMGRKEEFGGIYT